ncbi:hypothetical protein OM076_01470 [Solirubrobacter ginsenosidimutans]|uniref:DUF7144 domain-containing protein n=1 Tax=Solirubrobacter ginsenosidimutans TaxID=490573 RepID=A0A9X3MND2_9ACTN|nr:hypothetical protein [Solirubrobacter ginsenosidimutans]MDA0158917.1 hypothetical protein [Solirubrobacter ginsenosidimutans]
MAVQPTTPQAHSTRSGWVTFAGVMFLLVGAFNLIDGIVALVNDDYYVADELLFGDLTAWGIWWLVVGTAQAVTGIAILRRGTISWIFGLAIASVNALTQLLWLGAYPAWAIAAIIVDGLIIWALTTHVDEFV